MILIKNNRLRVIISACSIFCILSLAGCSSNSSTPYSYPATIAEGRAAVKDIMGKSDASSISLAFIEGNRLVWAETFVPENDKKLNNKPTTDTMYGICSLSKLVAAIAVMMIRKGVTGLLGI